MSQIATINPMEGVINPRDLECKASTIILLKRVAAVLVKHYPGWLWNLEADDSKTGGVFYIRSNRLHPTWGWISLLEAIQDDPSDKWIIEAGGEILERFRCKPGPYRRGCLKHLVKDSRGYHIPDISDQDKANQIRQQRQLLGQAMKDGAAKTITVNVGGQSHKYLGVDYDGRRTD